MDRLRHGGSFESFEWLCPTCDSAARKAAVTINDEGEQQEVGLPTLESMHPSLVCIPVSALKFCYTHMNRVRETGHITYVPFP